MLNTAKKVVDFLHSRSGVQQGERNHLGKVRLRRVEPVTHGVGIPEDVQGMLVQHRQMVESVGFPWRKSAFPAAAGQSPRSDPYDGREDADRSTEASS